LGARKKDGVAAPVTLFCLHMAGAAPQCGVLDDTRGPYRNEADCKARLGEMQGLFDQLLRDKGFRGAAKRMPLCRKLVKGTRI